MSREFPPLCRRHIPDCPDATRGRTHGRQRRRCLAFSLQRCPRRLPTAPTKGVLCSKMDMQCLRLHAQRRCPIRPRARRTPAGEDGTRRCSPLRRRSSRARLNSSPRRSTRTRNKLNMSIKCIKLTWRNRRSGSKRSKRIRRSSGNKRDTLSSNASDVCLRHAEPRAIRAIRAAANAALATAMASRERAPAVASRERAPTSDVCLRHAEPRAIRAKRAVAYAALATAVASGDRAAAAFYTRAATGATSSDAHHS